MFGMFNSSAATEIKGLENFDTSKVTKIRYMFYNSKATSLNLSSFDTSNVTSMLGMFQNSAAATLDLSNFNTSKVTDMMLVFQNSAATTLDLSSFDTSNVTDMRDMFRGSAATEIKGLEKFNTSKVTNMESMFRSSAAAILDLSNFDISNVIYMGWIFYQSKATTGYARTQEDADRFNASSEKPSTLTFIVKS